MVQSGKHGWRFLAEIRLAFPYLFDRHGFTAKVVGEERDGEYCLAVLQSASCLIRFHMEQGAPDYEFGTLDAPATMTEHPAWHSGDAIVAYLAKINPNAPVPPWPREKKEWSTDETLRMFSRRLAPLIGDIVSAFAENLEVKWWKDYQAERMERVRKIKEQIARGEKVILR
jgi:hypothetical protein